MRENGDLFPMSHCPNSPARCWAAPGLRGGGRRSESRCSVPRRALSGRLRESHPVLSQERESGQSIGICNKQTSRPHTQGEAVSGCAWSARCHQGAGDLGAMGHLSSPSGKCAGGNGHLGLGVHDEGRQEARRSTGHPPPRRPRSCFRA